MDRPDDHLVSPRHRHVAPRLPDLAAEMVYLEFVDHEPAPSQLALSRARRSEAEPAES